MKLFCGNIAHPLRQRKGHTELGPRGSEAGSSGHHGLVFFGESVPQVSKRKNSIEESFVTLINGASKPFFKLFQLVVFVIEQPLTQSQSVRSATGSSTRRTGTAPGSRGA